MDARTSHTFRAVAIGSERIKVWYPRASLAPETGCRGGAWGDNAILNIAQGMSTMRRAPARPIPTWVRYHLRNSSAETDEGSEGVSASAVCQVKVVIDAMGRVTYPWEV
jgi:hypothetical protein